MSPTDQVLAWLSAYGLPVLFGVILIASAGVPFPITFMLIAAGSFVELGELNLWPVIVLATCGAVIGDQIGYGIGRWASPLAVRIGAAISSEQRWKQAEAVARKWGGPGIFFSRWLITPLGPCINFTSGIAEYPWPRFLMWDIAGETIWVALFVMLGKLFSDRVQAMKDMIGNLTWAFVALFACIIFGWKLIQYMRAPRPLTKAPLAGVAADPPDHSS
jgi:membrane protein DedA with SNARE-associated domain